MLGNGFFLRRLIKKYNLQNEVKIIGVKVHNEVFNWLNEVDLYIQPSYQEGLCRIIVEAMSMACPILASNVGGNKELLNKNFLFDKGNINQIVDKIIEFNNEMFIKASKENFDNSKKYIKNILDKKRDNFYLSFINS